MMAFSSHLCANNYVYFPLYNLSKHIVCIACWDSITGEDSNLRIWITLNKFLMKPPTPGPTVRRLSVCSHDGQVSVMAGQPTEMTFNAASQLMSY